MEVIRWSERSNSALPTSLRRPASAATRHIKPDIFLDQTIYIYIMNIYKRDAKKEKEKRKKEKSREEGA